MVVHSPDLICCHYTLAGVSPASGRVSPWPLEERARACAEAGYKGLGLHLRDYRAWRRDGAGDADLAAILRRHGLRHVEIEFLRNWFADGEAGETSRRDEETLYRMAEVFGARILLLGGSMMGDQAAGWDQMVERFAALAGRARERGVTLAIEPCVGTSLQDVAQALRLIGEADARNAGVCLDIWHLYRRGLDYQALREIDPALVVGVQLSDAGQEVRGAMLEDCLDYRRLPGDGAADAETFSATLLEMGVAVPFGVEVVSKDVRALLPAEAAQITCRAARTVLDRALKRLSPSARAR